MKIIYTIILAYMVLSRGDGGYNDADKLGIPADSYSIYHIENAQKHQKKIYTPYTAVKLEGTKAYELKQFQKTDMETGIRYVTDQYGIDRYCIALGGYWTNMEVGRLVDVYMANEEIIPCITCDAKQWQHTINGKGQFGYIANDLIEFYVDPQWRGYVDYYFNNELNKWVGLMYPAGDVSFAAEKLKGEIDFLKVYDIYLPGFEY